jgi:predicted ATP-grasp superfamily ATP-dependent carboligase
MNKASNPMRILITGARAPIALDLARMFHRNQHIVYMADSISTPLSKKSNSCKQYFTVPSPRLQTDLFIERLSSLIKHFQIDILIPTCEEVFYISKHQDKLPTKVFCDDFNKLKKLHNKSSFIECCKSLPIHTPETYVIDRHLSINDLKDTKYVLKPIYSRFATHIDLDGNKDKMLNIQQNNPNQIIAQKYIEGSEYSSYGVAIDGKLTANVCYHSIYRVGKGSGILFQPVQIQEIHDFIYQFVKHHNYTGQIGFDFIKDKKGRYYVIECNPRGTSGLHFLKDQKGFVDAFTNPQTTCFPTHQNYKAIKLAVLCFSLPNALSPSKLKQLITYTKASQDIIYDKLDKAPAFYQFYSLLVIFLKCLFTFKSPLTISTYDIEYDG